MYIYKYQRPIQNLTKSFKRFLRILLLLCCSRFRLIILKQKFTCNFQGAKIEKELSRVQSNI